MAQSNSRRRVPLQNRRNKENEPESNISICDNFFNQCEKLKEKIVASSNNPSDLWLYRQELLDQYDRLILFDLDYALEKKIEHDLWTFVFKNEISSKQEQLKIHHQNPIQRAEIQTKLQLIYEYARGYYLKLFQDVVHIYNWKSSICKQIFPLLNNRSSSRQCKEASMLYFLQHILVHVGDLNRYSNQIDLAKLFYQYAIETIPCLGQPYNQIAILHEMKNPQSTLSLGQNQLITAYYYIRSIAIKVTFPSAISNLEKLFQRLKDTTINRSDQENDFYLSFLQFISLIYLEKNSAEQIERLIFNFRESMIKFYNLNNFIQIVVIIIFTLHRTLGLFPRSSMSNSSDQQFNFLIQLLMMIIEELLKAIQLPLSMMIIDEQQVLPIIYLTFAYLSNIQKHKIDLFEHSAFKEKSNMWNSFAKLLRSFGVQTRSLENSSSSLFHNYSDYPLPEERSLECFTPLMDLLKNYNFKKFFQETEESLAEKDQRQLRKFRIVFIVRQLCSKEILNHISTFVKDDVVGFESANSQLTTSNFGVPGDRRKSNNLPVRTPRGARNVALRQFLEPALANKIAAENSSKTVLNPTTQQNEPWPKITDSKDQSIDDETRINTVWGNTNECDR